MNLASLRTPSPQKRKIDSTPPESVGSPDKSVHSDSDGDADGHGHGHGHGDEVDVEDVDGECFYTSSSSSVQTQSRDKNGKCDVDRCYNELYDECCVCKPRSGVCHLHMDDQHVHRSAHVSMPMPLPQASKGALKPRSAGLGTTRPVPIPAHNATSPTAAAASPTAAAAASPTAAAASSTSAAASTTAAASPSAPAASPTAAAASAPAADKSVNKRPRKTQRSAK